MKKVAIIGFGCAGYFTAKTIRRHDRDSEIHIFSDHSEPPYNPLLTTYYAAGKISKEEMYPFGSLDDIQNELNLVLHINTRATKLDAHKRDITTSQGNCIHFDDIVICTGARAVLPPIAGLPSSGVYLMRTTQDAFQLKEALSQSPKRLLVVGAQMVGIKVVELAVKAGIEVTLVDMADRLFPLSAFPEVSEELQERLHSHGVIQKYNKAVSGVSGCEGNLEVTYSDGSSDQTDLIVFCSGIRSNIDFIDQADFQIDKTICTDLSMYTGVPHIYAAGDCCETFDISHSNQTYIGLWANAVLQGTTAGLSVCGLEGQYQGNLIHNITHYMHSDFISLGDIRASGTPVHFIAKDHSWQFHGVLDHGEIKAINILDKENASGVAKSILLRRTLCPGSRLSQASVAQLLQCGMTPSVIQALGGGTSDRT